MVGVVEVGGGDVEQSAPLHHPLWAAADVLSELPSQDAWSDAGERGEWLGAGQGAVGLRPLDPWRPDPSPVERAVRAALA